MKIQLAEDMVTHVRAILEQNQNPAELVAMNDVKTIAIEELIANCLEQAVAMAVDAADESLLENLDVKIYKNLEDLEDLEDPKNSEYGRIEDGGKTISAPNDLQRLILITADTWLGVAREIYDQSSPLYRIVNNRYIKSAGIANRPVIFHNYDDGGKKVISLYPKVNEQVKVVYVAKPEFVTIKEGENNGKQGIPCDKMIYEGACFYCAFLVAMTQDWSNAAYYRQEAVQALRANVAQTTTTTE